VRRWRFRPAMRNGAPAAGVVNVPITFDSGR
jgi:outer membrane biosynthesis protein TonB